VCPAGLQRPAAGLAQSKTGTGQPVRILTDGHVCFEKSEQVLVEGGAGGIDKPFSVLFDHGWHAR
jgi:hypothetical protein